MEKKHFKNENNELFYEPSVEVIENFKLIEITQIEFDSILADSQKLTDEQIKLNARAVRDSFLNTTDKMLTSDYTIADKRLSDVEREELIIVRDAFRKWPSSSDFPDLSKMPDMNYWLFFEALYLGWNAPDELKKLYGAI